MDSKVYSIDPDSNIVKKGKTVTLRRISFVIDFFILNVLTVVLTVGVNASFPNVLLICLLFSCWAYLIVVWIIVAILNRRFTFGRYMPLVVVSSSTINIIKLDRYFDASATTQYGHHNTERDSSEDRNPDKPYIHYPIPFSIVHIGCVNDILDQNLPGYWRYTYINTRLVKETKYCYRFIGDLVDKADKIQPGKKFKIAKIYKDHETLMAVD